MVTNRLWCEGLAGLFVGTLFGERVYKRLKLTNSYLVDTKMTYRRINSMPELEHTLVSGAAQIRLCIILEPFL